MRCFIKSFTMLCLVLVIASLFTAIKNIEPVATDVILQSKDGGLTWEDISSGLPDNSLPEDFGVVESEVYMRVKDITYRRKGNLKTPFWERENDVPINWSGMKTNYGDQIFPSVPSGEGAWLPVYTNSRKQTMRSVFDTADGSIILGYRYGLYKSVDNGQSWERIPKDSGFGQLLSSKDVSVISVNKVGTYLLCTHADGIFQSSDMGKTWNRVHSSLDNGRKEMFAIYVSGNVIYAVASRSEGC